MISTYYPSEVRASSSYPQPPYEKQQKNKIRTNLENFVLKEKLVDKNGWQHYVYQADECAIHGVYFRATTKNWDRVIATT